jgi:hypothetical protein
MSDNLVNPHYVSEEGAAKQCDQGRHEWAEFGEGPEVFCLHCGHTQPNQYLASCNPGDRVYYHVARAGWGGGESYRAVAVVEKTSARMATIILFNERTQRREAKRVSLSSLTPRDTHSARVDGVVRESAGGG